MSRRRRGSGERYVLLPHWLLKCPAWRTASPKAKALLLHLWERHNGANNSDIVYGVREAKEVGIGRNDASKALADLVMRGFLQVGRDSAFNVKTKQARTWRLTAEPAGGRPATKDFMRWSNTSTETSTGTSTKTRSRPRDCAGEAEFKTQSRIGDHTVPPAGQCATILPISVPYTGPSEAISTPSQSRPRDTSNIPWGTEQFDGAPPAEARGGVTVNESNDAARVERRIDDEEGGGRGLTRLGDILDNALRGAGR